MNEQTRRRFWSKVDRRGIDECWLWTAGTYGKTGYGSFWLNGRSYGAHVAVFLVEGIELPPGSQVLHGCDVPLCCNFLRHLEAGDQSKNIRDAHARGRIDQYGERNPMAKLSADDVREIRRRYDGKRGRQAQLCREFSIHPTTMNEIVHRRIWVGVEP